jgi:hypothetical protein
MPLTAAVFVIALCSETGGELCNRTNRVAVKIHAHAHHYTKEIKREVMQAFTDE